MNHYIKRPRLLSLVICFSAPTRYVELLFSLRTSGEQLPFFNSSGQNLKVVFRNWLICPQITPVRKLSILVFLDGKNEA